MPRSTRPGPARPGPMWRRRSTFGVRRPRSSRRTRSSPPVMYNDPRLSGRHRMPTHSDAPPGSPHPFNTGAGWDERYASAAGLGVPGTFTHSNAGNRQFYRTKFHAVDRCLDRTGGLWGKTVFDAAGGSGQFVDYFLGKGARHVAVADFS